MPLSLVDPFSSPYEVWSYRNPTVEEVQANGHARPVRDARQQTVPDAASAAAYIARVQMDNGLGNHIDEALSASAAFKSWQAAMPTKTPSEIAIYQRNYPKSDLLKVAQEIDLHGDMLTPGQRLFHAGAWPGVTRLTTTKPLSTTLCPQVALRNAEHSAKAYNAGRIDLLVLEIAAPTAKAFVFKRKGTNLGHESEVLLAPGANLVFKSTQQVRDDYPAAKYGCPAIQVPVYLSEVEVS